MKRKVLNGYYYTMVEYDAPLKLQPYAQAGVRYFAEPSSLNPDNYDRLNVVQLVSYVTPILVYKMDLDELYIVFDPTYSTSTRKHVISFLREFVPNVTYQQVRDAYNAYLKDDKEKYIISAGEGMTGFDTLIIVQS